MLLQPLDSPITNDFGPRRSIQLPDGQWTIPFHYGIDYATKTGTPIYNTHDATVVISGWDDGTYVAPAWPTNHYGGGYWVIAQSGDWLFYYMHLNKPSKLKVGQKIRQGQLIGYVGSTGASTGPHLHFEMHRLSTPIDPELWFNKKLPGSITFSKDTMKYQRSHKPGITVKPGKLSKRLSFKSGTISIPSKKRMLVTGGAYIVGKAGTPVQLILVRDFFNSKGVRTKTTANRRVSGIVDSTGRARLQVTGVVSPQKNVRWRLVLQNDSKTDAVQVTYVTLDGK